MVKPVTKTCSNSWPAQGILVPCSTHSRSPACWNHRRTTVCVGVSPSHLLNLHAFHRVSARTCCHGCALLCYQAVFLSFTLWDSRWQPWLEAWAVLNTICLWMSIKCGWMIYAYMRIQMNSEPITTSYTHNFLKLVVSIYFAVIVITSRIREEDRRRRHRPLSPPQLAGLLLFIHSRSTVDAALCALITCASLILCEFRD